MKRITITLSTENEEFLNKRKAEFLLRKNTDISYSELINRAIGFMFKQKG